MKRCLIILLLIPLSLLAQERTVILVDAIPYSSAPRVPMQVYITRLTRLSGDSLVSCEGVVRDSMTNENLIGVNVIPLHKKGAATDTIGKFRLDSLSLRDSLKVSYFPYQSRVIPVRDLHRLPGTPPRGTRHAMSHRDSTMVAWSTKMKRPQTDTAATEIPITIYVSSDNGAYANPVHLTVSVDQKKGIIEGDYPATPLAISEYHLLLSKGVHRFLVESNNGDAEADMVLPIEKPAWIAITYWGKNHIQMYVSFQPLVFL